MSNVNYYEQREKDLETIQRYLDSCKTKEHYVFVEKMTKNFKKTYKGA